MKVPGRTIDRRAVLRAGTALGAGLLLPRAARARGRTLPVEDPGRTLVVIQLAGGNDGLDTVVPFREDAYHRARPELRVAPGDGLRITDDLALHPLLPRLFAQFDEGRVALVQGVGYPQPNRSHFESFDVWHAGHPRGRALEEGWIGRLLSARFGDESNPTRVVHLGGEPPYSLHSRRHPPASMISPIQYRWVEGDDDLVRIVNADSEAGASTDRARLLERLRVRTRAAHDSSLRLRRAASRPRRFDYPDTRFGASLRAAAAILDSDVEVRVLSLEMTGFDTHGDQLRQRTRLLNELDGGLASFLDDLETFEKGRDALVLVFSEFGRRVAENASRGTDHGAAGPAFVVGHAVRGGVYGEHPSLEDLDEGDLAHTMDFRSIYAELGWEVFGVPADEFLFEDFPRLELVG